MWAAITALIGFGTSANAGAQAQYGQQRAEYDSSIGFIRAKDMAYYEGYAAEGKTMMLIVLIGFLLIGVTIFAVTRK